MNPNARLLSMRDPALAVLLGIIPGADFGGESRQGADFGGEFGGEYGAEYGADYGAEYGADYGYDPSFNGEYGADWGYDPGFHGPAGGAQLARRGPPVPPPAVAAQLLANARARSAKTGSRIRLIEPNHGSEVNVERYSFSLNQTITLGTAVALSMSGSPDVNIRPQRCTMNVPAPGFATLNELKVANVSATVGGIGDAFEYAAVGVGMSLDMPTLKPSNKASMSGNYSGFVPPGYVGASSFIFCVSFKGPATITA